MSGGGGVWKDDPSKLCHAKWQQNKGFAHVAVIRTSQVPFGAGDFPGKKDKEVKGLGKRKGKILVILLTLMIEC